MANVLNSNLFSASVATIFALVLSACSGSESTPSPQNSNNMTSATSNQTTTTQTSQPPVDRGAVVFRKCRTCHTLGQGERHRVGPNLYGIFGQAAGEKEGFAYSKALKSSGIIWDDAAMSGYLENPAKYVPGGRMTFVGLRKEEDRVAVINYLREKTSSPTPKTE